MRLRPRDLTFMQYAANIRDGYSLWNVLAVSLLPAIPFAMLVQLVICALWDMPFWAPAALIPLYVCFQLTLLIALASLCFEFYYIADMPWRDWRTWVFVLMFLAVPIGWLCLLSSYRQMNLADLEYENHQGQLPQEVLALEINQRVADVLRQARQDADDANDPQTPALPALLQEVLGDDEFWHQQQLVQEDDEVRPPVARRNTNEAQDDQEIRIVSARFGPEGSPYYSSPNAALEVYVGLRSEHFSDRRRKDVQRADRKVDEALDTIEGLRGLQSEAAARAKVLRDQFGENSEEFKQAKELVMQRTGALRQAQRQRNTLQATRNHLTAAETAAASAETAREEFQRMLALPNVQAVQVLGDDIKVIVTPRIQYEGVEYDLGDWGLTFGVSGDLRARLIRESLRKSWRERGVRHPAYRYVSNTERFCFAAREEELQRLANNGQFFELVMVAVECLHYVNPEDRRYIPEAFKRSNT